MRRRGGTSVSRHQASNFCERLGIELRVVRAGRRMFARQCLDWSERRPHLAGALGAALTARAFENCTVERTTQPRGISVTATGEAAFMRHFRTCLFVEPRVDGVHFGGSGRPVGAGPSAPTAPRRKKQAVSAAPSVSDDLPSPRSPARDFEQACRGGFAGSHEGARSDNHGEPDDDHAQPGRVHDHPSDSVRERGGWSPVCHRHLCAVVSWCDITSACIRWTQTSDAPGWFPIPLFSTSNKFSKCPRRVDADHYLSMRRRSWKVRIRNRSRLCNVPGGTALLLVPSTLDDRVCFPACDPVVR